MTCLHGWRKIFWLLIYLIGISFLQHPDNPVIWKIPRAGANMHRDIAFRNPPVLRLHVPETHVPSGQRERDRLPCPRLEMDLLVSTEHPDRCSGWDGVLWQGDVELDDGRARVGDCRCRIKELRPQIRVPACGCLVVGGGKWRYCSIRRPRHRQAVLQRKRRIAQP